MNFSPLLILIVIFTLIQVTHTAVISNEIIGTLVSSCDDRNNIYKISKKLGHGCYGDVFAATDVQSGREIAIKKACKIYESEYLKEVTITKLCRHDNIISFVNELLPDEHYWQHGMEYMDGGSLNLIDEKHRMGEDVLAAICREILRGVSYLHARGIVHEDLACKNILFSSKGEVKIADFGISSIYDMNTISDAQREKYNNETKRDIQYFHNAVVLALIKKHHRSSSNNKNQLSNEFQDFSYQCSEGKDVDTLLGLPFLANVANSVAMARFFQSAASKKEVLQVKMKYWVNNLFSRIICGKE